jgi:cell division protein ZapE
MAVLSLESLLRNLREKPALGSVVGEFVPPRRFAGKTFENYHPRHPSQEGAASRLSDLVSGLSGERAPLLGLLNRRRRSGPRGVYLDGGFGVGKTHLLAAGWHLSSAPRAYLTFDELIYLVGLVGPGGAASAFTGYRLVAVDEWELDDPGNLKMALAFLRAVLAAKVFVAVTSNTLPLELGAGRFSQKDFRAEIEELAAAFEVIRIIGEDYRHRRFAADPGREYFVSAPRLEGIAASAPEGAVRISFPLLLDGIASIHPFRFRELARGVEMWMVEDVEPVRSLPAALRWVHFVDSLYDSAVPLVATGRAPLGDLFSDAFLTGPYGKKLSRCLSRMEEMLGEGVEVGDAGGIGGGVNRGE